MPSRNPAIETTTSQAPPRKHRLASGSSIYLLSNILNAAMPFALLPVLTRYLGPAQYGEVAMFQTLLATLAAFTGLSVQGAAARKYYDKDVTQQQFQWFLGACLQVLIVSSALVFLLVFVFRESLSSWLGLETRWVLWAVLASATSFVVFIRLEQWQVRGEPIHYGTLQVTQSLFSVLLSLFLVVALLWASAGRITALILTPCVFSVIALFSLHRNRLLGFSWKPGYIREALLFGVPLIPHVAGGFLLSSVDRYVINGELGLAKAGIYMVAVQLAGVMALMFDAFNKAYMPWLFEHLQRDDMTEKRQIVRLTYGYFAVVLVLAGLAFLLGPYAVTLVAGEEFAEAGQAIGWLALGHTFGGMYLMVCNYIFYSKRTGLLSLATLSSGLLNIALLLLLIKPFGLTGAAQAFCIAMAIRFLLTWWVAHKRHPMPWFNLPSRN